MIYVTAPSRERWEREVVVLGERGGGFFTRDAAGIYGTRQSLQKNSCGVMVEPVNDPHSGNCVSNVNGAPAKANKTRVEILFFQK